MNPGGFSCAKPSNYNNATTFFAFGNEGMMGQSNVQANNFANVGLPKFSPNTISPCRKQTEEALSNFQRKSTAVMHQTISGLRTSFAPNLRIDEGKAPANFSDNGSPFVKLEKSPYYTNTNAGFFERPVNAGGVQISDFASNIQQTGYYNAPVQVESQRPITYQVEQIETGNKFMYPFANQVEAITYDSSLMGSTTRRRKISHAFDRVGSNDNQTGCVLSPIRTGNVVFNTETIRSPKTEPAFKRILHMQPGSPGVEVNTFQRAMSPLPRNTENIGQQNMMSPYNGMGIADSYFNYRAFASPQPVAKINNENSNTKVEDSALRMAKNNPQLYNVYNSIKSKVANPTKVVPNIKPTISEEEFSSDHAIHEEECSAFKNDYLVGKSLGSGAYATVRVALHKSQNRKVAVKTYEKSKISDAHRRKNVMNEISVMKKLKHPNIAEYYKDFEGKDFLHIVMEYVDGSSMYHYLKSKPQRRLPEEEGKSIFKQVLTAISYCHSNMITHRDVKLENLIRDPTGIVKLIDFGFSTCFPHSTKVKMFCGTPSYMAPEIVARKEFHGPPADIWALGVLLFTFFCGTFPFKGENDNALYANIQKGVFTVPDHVPEGPANIIKMCLEIDAKSRPTINQLLNHWWIEPQENVVPPRKLLSSLGSAERVRDENKKIELSLPKSDVKALEEVKRPAILKQSGYPRTNALQEKQGNEDTSTRTNSHLRVIRGSQNLSSALKVLEINATAPLINRDCVSPQPRTECNQKYDPQSRPFSSPQFMDAYMSVKPTKIY